MTSIFEHSKLQIGDILLYHGTGGIARAIRYMDNSDFNHTSIYIGENQVVEAVRHGVLVAPLNQSINHYKVLVKRLIDKPADMSPVVGCVGKYVGKRYGYEQILLLAIICTTRRFRINNFVLRLVGRVLEKAATILLKFTRGDKRAMICSELVYRAYDEVNPSHNDPYTIQLLSKVMANSKSKSNMATEEGSLLQRFYGTNEKWTNQSVSIAQSNQLSKEFIDRLDSETETLEEFDLVINNLMNDVEESYKIEDYEISPEIVQQCKSRMDTFIVSYVQSYNNSEKILSPIQMDSIIDKLVRRDPNFVTPGDLQRAVNLFSLGWLQQV